jgi:hypothetical protein
MKLGTIVDFDNTVVFVIPLVALLVIARDMAYRMPLEFLYIPKRAPRVIRNNNYRNFKYN